MTGKKIISSQRVHISEFVTQDASFIIQLLNSPGWKKFIGERHVNTEADAVKYLKNGPLDMYDRHGFGLWKVALRAEGTPIGMCGFLQRPTLPFPDLGFAFLPQFNGLGYAFESASACLSVADKLGISKICAITVPENKNSIRLLEKLGMHFEKEIIHPPENELLHMYIN